MNAKTFDEKLESADIFLGIDKSFSIKDQVQMVVANIGKFEYTIDILNKMHQELLKDPKSKYISAGINSNNKDIGNNGKYLIVHNPELRKDVLNVYVISDIDDTVKVTSISDHHRMLYILLFNPYMAV